MWRGWGGGGLKALLLDEAARCTSARVWRGWVGGAAKNPRPAANNQNPPSGEWEARSATRRDAAQRKSPARGLPTRKIGLGVAPRKGMAAVWHARGEMLVVCDELGWACHCAGISIMKSAFPIHHVSLGWMLITVQPSGQLPVPRVIVSFVPSSAGQ